MFEVDAPEDSEEELELLELEEPTVPLSAFFSDPPPDPVSVLDSPDFPSAVPLLGSFSLSE